MKNTAKADKGFLEIALVAVDNLDDPRSNMKLFGIYSLRGIELAGPMEIVKTRLNQHFLDNQAFHGLVLHGLN